MIQLYQDFQDRISSAINLGLWKLLIMDFESGLEEEKAKSRCVEECRVQIIS